MAGMSSVAYMDVAIGSMVTVICIIAAPMLLVKAGGWSGSACGAASQSGQLPEVRGNLTLVRALEFLVPTCC